MGKENCAILPLMRMVLLAQIGALCVAGSQPALTPEQSGTRSRLQAVSAVNERIVWASGVGGTWVKTTDGGSTWSKGTVAGAETLEFRDVQGVNERVAYLLSAGKGSASRIYKTVDGGVSWTLQSQNPNPAAFYDCFAFWTANEGLATSDSVDARFPAIRTLDGVAWQGIEAHLPPAQPGEASFAASGTCTATEGRRRAWIGTGGAAKARVLRTLDRGETWEAFETPVVQGTETSGVFTIAFRDALHGMLGAGDLAAPNAPANTIARSRDGGRRWELTKRPPVPGAIYGLSYALSQRLRNEEESDDEEHSEYAERSVVITGPSGAAWTPDEGDTWFRLPAISNFWAVAFADAQTGWLVGTEGRILKVRFPRD